MSLDAEKGRYQMTWNERIQMKRQVSFFKGGVMRNQLGLLTFFFLTGLLAARSGYAQPAQNLLMNGGFEDGFSDP